MPNTALPIITGTATEGQLLSCSDGLWTNSPTIYTKQWIRCDAAGANGVAIASATGSTYMLAAADVGATIRCAVSAYNSIGAAAVVQTAQTGVVSALAAAVPVVQTAPAISGTPTVGYTLTISNGVWTNAPTSYVRQWRRCDAAGGACVDIAGATNATYILTTTDVGKTIRCKTTAVNATGNSAVNTSAASAVVAAAAVSPAPPPAGAVQITTFAAFDGAFLPGWAVNPIPSNVTIPSGLGGGVSIVDTPYGKGFRFVTTDTMRTIWDNSMKTCALKGKKVVQGATEDWRFAFNIPSAGNPQGIANTWNGMVFWECGHTAIASGHSVCIDGRKTVGNLGLMFRRHRAPWGAGDYDLIRIEDPRFDRWYEGRQLVKWSSGSDGFIKFWCDGRLICDYVGPTMPPGDVPYLILCNYSTVVAGVTKNEVVIAGVSVKR